MHSLSVLSTMGTSAHLDGLADGTANEGPNHRDKRKDLLFDVPRGYQPDIVWLQEALRGFAGASGECTFRSE
jgi:hypothetical protein